MIGSLAENQVAVNRKISSRRKFFAASGCRGLSEHRRSCPEELPFTSGPATLLWLQQFMRSIATLLALTVVAAFTGCAGPERKLGRGLNNFTEMVRMGELRRSIEQTALWDGNDRAFTTGFVRGINRTVARTAVGFYEVATFPLPSYEPVFAPKSRLYPDPSVVSGNKYWGGLTLPAGKVYPESYRPGFFADQLFATDTSLGFSGGDVAPFIMGSRFHIFDY